MNTVIKLTSDKNLIAIKLEHIFAIESNKNDSKDSNVMTFISLYKFPSQHPYVLSLRLLNWRSLHFIAHDFF